MRSTLRFPEKSPNNEQCYSAFSPRHATVTRAPFTQTMSAMLKRREPPSAQFKQDADEEYSAIGAGEDDDAFLAAAAAATDAVASQSPAKKAKAGELRTLTAEKNDEGELFFSVGCPVPLW
jgi:hypothetical protein